MPLPIIKITKLSRAQVNNLINVFAGNIRIRVDRSNSYIQIPGTARIAFSVPEYRRRIGVAFLSFTWRSYPSDINSNRVNVSLRNRTPNNPRGSMISRVSFETRGHEIHGTLHADVRNMSVTVALGFALVNNKVTYRADSVRVNVSLDIVDIEGIPDWLPGVGRLKNTAERKIKEEVKSRITAILSRGNVRNGFADFLTSKIKGIIGRNRKIISFVIRNNVVRIGHIPA